MNLTTEGRDAQAPTYSRPLRGDSYSCTGNSPPGEPAPAHARDAAAEGRRGGLDDETAALLAVWWSESPEHTARRLRADHCPQRRAAVLAALRKAKGYMGYAAVMEAL